MQDRIRRATVDDQVAITRLVHQARLNPRGLDWRRFVIAEAATRPLASRRYAGIRTAAGSWPHWSSCPSTGTAASPAA